MRSERPKLAYVVNALNPGGTERLVIDMSLAFLGDYDVSVICLDEPGVWAAELRAKGVPVHCLWRQPGLDLSMPVRLARIFRGLNVDIVHAHQCTPWFYCALSRIFYSRPQLLFQEHGRFYPEQLSRKRRWVNKVMVRRLTHRFIAVSQDIRSRLVTYEGLVAEEIDVVYNGVNPPSKISPASRRELRNELGYSDEEFVVGTVGRLDPIKNLPMLVEGIDAALKSAPNIRGLVVGGGPEEERIRACIESQNLSEKVTLTGFRSDAQCLVQCMDLFVLASFSEGTSMALLEAVAAEIPVVVTDVGGNPEVVLDGSTGWVVPSGSAKDLVCAILDAVGDPEMAASFAEQGRQRFVDKFTFDRMIERYHSAYSELL